MHYKNGREAKNGDKVVSIPSWVDGDGKRQYGTPVVGVLFDAKPGIDACNGYLAPITTGLASANLNNDCLHVDDFLAALPESVPDISKKS